MQLIVCNASWVVIRYDFVFGLWLFEFGWVLGEWLLLMFGCIIVGSRVLVLGTAVLVLVMVDCVCYFGCFCLGFDLGLRLWWILIRLRWRYLV